MSKESLCEKLRAMLEEEHQAVREYGELLSEIEKMVPYAYRDMLSEAFRLSIIRDEEKHGRLLEIVMRLLSCTRR